MLVKTSIDEHVAIMRVVRKKKFIDQQFINTIQLTTKLRPLCYSSLSHYTFYKGLYA